VKQKMLVEVKDSKDNKIGEVEFLISKVFRQTQINIEK
jgi:hypothetical protein